MELVSRLYHRQNERQSISAFGDFKDKQYCICLSLLSFYGKDVFVLLSMLKKRSFFYRCFVICLFVFLSLSSSVMAAQTGLDDFYSPNDVEKSCYIYVDSASTKYDHANTTIYCSGSAGGRVVGWLDESKCLNVSSLGHLANPNSESLIIKSVVDHYDKDDEHIRTVVSDYVYGTWYDYKLSSLSYNEYSEIYELHMTIFSSRSSAVAYATSGDTSGLIYDSSAMTDDNATYDTSIGYLQNVKFNSRNVGKDNSDLSNLTYHFSYDSVTNTGFNIDQDGVRVSFYSTYKGIYYNNWGSYFKKDGNIKRFDNKILQKSASRMDRLNFSYEDCMKSHSQDKAELDKLCDSSVPTFGAIEYWLRVEQRQPDGTWRYGGWVYLANNSTSAQGGSVEEDYITQTIDGDGNLDKDGGYGTGTSTVSTYGEGVTADEADVDAEENEKRKKDKENSATYRDSFESIDDFKDYLGLMKSSLQSIPQIIGETFTALPPLIIIAISSGFLVCIVLRILGR